jgi:hypothetical protein
MGDTFLFSAIFDGSGTMAFIPKSCDVGYKYFTVFDGFGRGSLIEVGSLKQLPRLQRGTPLVASYQKLRIWLISARVSDAAHHLTHVRGRNPRGRPAHALQQNLSDLRGFVPGMGEEFGFADDARMKTGGVLDTCRPYIIWFQPR